MSGYGFLKGLRVIEVAQLGPSSLGGYLADMGAEVIKVEGADGDPIRSSGTPAVGTPNGYSFLHLRWNRGKKSIGIDLKSDRGIALFKKLVAESDVVIEGMRAGVLDRLGLGYEVLSAINPRIVFCSISGLGRSGPYSALGSHGPSYDAFGALSSMNPYSLTAEEKKGREATAIGMHSMGLHAAIGTLSAVIQARATGKGALIEVAAAESAAHWLPDGVDVALNADKVFPRPGFLGDSGRQAHWPRMYRYDCKDGKGVFFQAFGDKFWKRFCNAIHRPDLLACYASGRDVSEVDVEVHAELCEILGARPLAEWMDFFRQYDVPGTPANTIADLAEDPHFLARDNVYEVDLPNAMQLRMATTPIKTPDQTFSATIAPRLGQDTDQILSTLLHLNAAEIADLRASNIVFEAPKEYPK